MMTPLDVLTCVSRTPLLSTVSQCDPVNVAVRFPPTATDWASVWTTGLVGVVAALLGSSIGAWIAIRHGMKMRKMDEDRHLTERVADLVHRLDNVRRVASDYYDDKATGRNRASNAESGPIHVHKAPEGVLAEGRKALVGVSEGLGYLTLVAPEQIANRAKLAAGRVDKLYEMLETEGGFMESDYMSLLNSFDAARTDLVHAIAPALRHGS